MVEAGENDAARREEGAGKETVMNEMRTQLTEEQLAEMDRILCGEKLRGRLWLQHAVAVYKELLVQRQAQLEGLHHLRVVEGGRSAASHAH